MGFLKRRIRKLLLRLLKPLFDGLSMGTHCLYGSTERLKISKNALVTNTLFNTYSGEILIGEHVFTGHNVSMITGAHNYNLKNAERKQVEPKEGNDIIIEKGVWIGSNAVILGPCKIGEHSVIAAGAIVTKDIPSGVIVGGIPARIIQTISFRQG